MNHDKLIYRTTPGSLYVSGPPHFGLRSPGKNLYSSLSTSQQHACENRVYDCISYCTDTSSQLLRRVLSVKFNGQGESCSM